MQVRDTHELTTHWQEIGTFENSEGHSSTQISQGK